MVRETGVDKCQLRKAFVQANTIKGYRYLDLSGVVLNKIGERYNQGGIDPDGCLLTDPKDSKDPRSIRFTANRIWLHYEPIESLAHVIDTAPEWIESIAKEFLVTRFSRLGLRVEYFAPCADIVRASAELSKKISGDIFQSAISEVGDRDDADVEYRVRVPLDNLTVGIRVATQKIARPPQTALDYPSDGLVFDMDIYRKRKPPDGIPRAETRGFLKAASDKASDLLGTIGYSLLLGGL